MSSIFHQESFQLFKSQVSLFANLRPVRDRCFCAFGNLIESTGTNLSLIQFHLSENFSLSAIKKQINPKDSHIPFDSGCHAKENKSVSVLSLFKFVRRIEIIYPSIVIRRENILVFSTFSRLFPVRKKARQTIFCFLLFAYFSLSLLLLCCRTLLFHSYYLYARSSCLSVVFPRMSIECCSNGSSLALLLFSSDRIIQERMRMNDVANNNITLVVIASSSTR